MKSYFYWLCGGYKGRCHTAQKCDNCPEAILRVVLPKRAYGCLAVVHENRERGKEGR